ncbi:translational activator of GCN4 [Puccinia graminis f. sp. tritici]|uniref:Translational activator of GCN4 n=1 Tax=Puccinia graminis f. sp. tritici TaxID=56615 RepID=A0A5B0NK28_PUCGR|nr:translational activator of GCN4, variant 2 [Puccinia graminis f. sp. tritici]KAA1105526.1 translational activator of GCN4 [Puccinia graminis f. sp. tritici]
MAPDKELIRKWISSSVASTSEMDDEDEDGIPVSDRLTWEMAMQQARPKIITTKLSIRIPFLRDELLPLLRRDKSPSISEASGLLKVLFQTIPRYDDTDSRKAAISVLIALIEENDEISLESSSLGLRSTVIKWLSQEASKSCGKSHGGACSATSTRLALLVWTASLLENSFSHPPSQSSQDSTSISTLVNALGALLDSLQDPQDNRPAFQKSGTVIVRRTIRNNQKEIPRLFDILTSSNSASVNASFLGVVIDVSLRLRVGKEPIKGARDGVGVGYIMAFKNQILDWWITQILGSRSILPAWTTSAFRDFSQQILTPDDFTQTVIPPATKFLLRSPEVALPALTQFISMSTFRLPGEIGITFLPAILSSSKSSNPETRKSSLSFFETLFGDEDSDVLLKVVEEISLPIKIGKTSSPEHRATLLNALASLKPNASFSPSLIKLCCDLLGKETNENALMSVGATIHRHLKFLIDAGFEIDPAAVQAISKSMQDPKPLIRKTVCSAIGLSLWRPSQVNPQAPEDTKPQVSEYTPQQVLIHPSFLVSLTKAFEANLKNASTNPLASAGGPFEGYVAVALCGSSLLRHYAGIQTMWENNPVLCSLAVGTPKPSFLFLDRLYRKSTASPDENMWLARALDSIFEKLKSELDQDPVFRNLYAQAVLFLCLECTSHETRKLTSALACEWFKQDPKLVCHFLMEGLRTQALKSTTYDLFNSSTLGARLKSLLASMFKNTKNMSAEVRRELLVESFVTSHHQVVDDSSSLWIGLVRTAALDPEEVISSNFKRLTQHIQDSITAVSADSNHLCDAAYRAVTTMCLVTPQLAYPEISEYVRESLDPEKFIHIGSFELGVWNTPPGQTFHDVLAPQQQNQVQGRNGQDSIEKWEQELRASLEQKKAGGAKILTKAEKALVDAQLSKETDVRAQVTEALSKLKHGFCLIHSLMQARKAAENVITDYAASLVDICLKALQLEVVTLIPTEGFVAFSVMGDFCTERLGSSRLPLTMCILRGLGTKVVPADMTAESLSDLITRTLYKIRSLAEQQAIDCRTFCYFAPLLSHVITKGGLGITASQIEESLEQVALAVDIISFAGPEATKIQDLRSRLIQDCLSVISKYPQLIKAATSALVAVVAAASSDATDQDIHILSLGFLSAESQARYAALQAAQPLDMTDIGWSLELWIACHDEDERNANLASDLWLENGLQTPECCLKSLLELLEHHAPAIRNAAAKSVAETVKIYPHLGKVALAEIAIRYQYLARELVPEYDKFGMIIPESLDRNDPWQHRLAQAQAFCLLAPSWENDDILPLFDFLVAQKALGDRNEEVRTRMLAAGNAAIDLRGSEHLEKLISILEDILTRSGTGTDAADHITEAAVLLFGRVARHLRADDERLKVVITRLVDALKTPSEVVQSAVSDCLPPLVRLRKEQVPILIQRLLIDTLNASKYAERRGAAYGLAGAIKGRGMTSIQEFSIVDRLRDALEDKKNSRARQGSLFAFEILAGSLGRLFEPYLIPTISAMLAAFGDSAAEVREAIQDTAREIMRGLSGHAVKLILPSLLNGLDDKQWRTKKGAIELMGAMAYLAPKQLSMSLPTIIPRLTEVLTDTHAQVRAAANSSLKRFGEVVSNPEISAMQNILLAALVDPARKTGKALDNLLGTAFVHYVDTSSLALIVPIIERGLRERSADIKRKATQIVGNLATLAEAKDLSPYLPQLMPRVRQVLVDPVPEARATAAKALGSLVERLGEESFPDLVPSLFDTLRTEVPGVDQQGAAQGLSEIMSGLGTEKLDDLLPDIITNTSSPKAFVREGFISLLVFLPATYGDRFSPYLGRIIRPVLNGLADDSDYVRDASMRAGRMIVINHSTKAIELLMPELEQGLFHESWRIRQSSIQLLGDLLFRISGIAAKADLGNEEGEEDEVAMPSADASRVALVDTLGKERRDRVLAAVYITRQDSSSIVRSTSVHIWKALVNNTPKTAREIMPTLMQTLIRILASPGEEQRETAARTLGELVRKLGENILAVINKTLQSAMQSEDVRVRQGVSLAVIDIIASISQTQLEDNQGPLIAIVRSALLDNSDSVRSTAAKAFDALQQRLGSKVVEETLPALLHALRQSGSTPAASLAALTELMRVGASSILPQILPVLTKSPITTFNARALSSLVSVSGGSIARYISAVVDSLRSSWCVETDEEIREAIDSSLRVIFGSLDELDSINSLMMHLLEVAKSPMPSKRVDGCDLFGIFCASNNSDRSEYNVLWIRQLVSLLDDPVSEVVNSAWLAVEEMVKAMPKSQMDALVIPLRRTIESSGLPGRYLPGLSRPSGLKPFMPILLQGILAGTAEQREQAALAFGNLVERTSEEHVKPYVTQITGPLIRIMGDRFPAPVKSAILQTLAILLMRIPQYVKPFFPQLQRTFMKSLHDGTSITVRNKSIAALGLLMKHQPRIDPLIIELLGSIQNSEDKEIRESFVSALSAVVASGAANITEGPMNDIVKLIEEIFHDERHSEPLALALSTLGSAVTRFKPSRISNVISFILSNPPTAVGAVCIREMIENASEALYELGIEQDVVDFVLSNSAGGVPPNIGRPLREAKELLSTTPKFCNDERVQSKI